jgi:N-acetylneuraminic acid mutarotase
MTLIPASRIPASRLSKLLPLFAALGIAVLALAAAGCTQAAGAGVNGTPTAVWEFTVVPVGTPAPTPTPTPVPTPINHEPDVELDPGFELAGSLSQGRWGLTVTVLDNGTVIAVGGQERRSFSRNSPIEAELLTDGSDDWLKTEPMRYERSFHTVTKLPDGRLLVAGGSGREVLTEEEAEDRPFRGRQDLSSVEVFDVKTGEWSEVAEMQTRRQSGGAVLLGDGTVLVIGGSSGVAVEAKAEYYVADDDTWVEVAPMSQARKFHTVTQMIDGRVLVAGGQTREAALASTEIYDPSDGTWTNVADLVRPRSGHTASLLRDGRVMVVGGSDLGATNVLGPETSAEIYDPVADEWTVIYGDLRPRLGHAAVTLTDGRVVVVGGEDLVGLSIDAVEVYQPATDTWKIAGTLPDGRSLLAATLMPDGSVLIVGGGTASGFVTFPDYVLRFRVPK